MKNLLSFVDLDLDMLLIIVGSFVVLVGVVCAIFAVKNAVKNGQKPQKIKKGQEEISADDYLEELEVRDEYLVLPRNVMYTVGHEGQISAGKYTVKNAVDNGEAFNVRFNGLVREFQNDTTVHLAEGDTLCCVSTSMLIKPL